MRRFRCRQCGHRFMRARRLEKCPLCKSPNWEKPRKRLTWRGVPRELRQGEVERRYWLRASARKRAVAYFKRRAGIIRRRLGRTE